MIISMSWLKKRQEKIQQKRKSTPWREYLLDICSWLPLVLHRNNGVISRYPESNRHWVLMDAKDFYNAEPVSLEIDSSKSFFAQLIELHKLSPWAHIFAYTESVNADYADMVFASKNCYLSNTVIKECENIYYSYNAKDWCSNVFSSVLTWQNCENIYFCLSIISSFNCFYSQYLRNCSDVWFSSNLQWCSHCILCSELENQSYCIQNKQYTKDEYEEMKRKILSDKSRFEEFYAIVADRVWNNILTEDVINWVNCYKCSTIENSKNCFQLDNWRNLINIWWPDKSTNFYDVISAWAWAPSSDFYGVFGAWLWANHLYISNNINNSNNIFYSINMEYCSYCLWCVWLKNKSYCIFNKQYEKEDRYKKVDEIFTKMESSWTLGDCFPWEINPFNFNDTAWYLFDETFTKQEVEAQWYMWREGEITTDIPDNVDVVSINELDSFEWYTDGKREIHSDVLKKVIKDDNGNIYRIVKPEYDFLMKNGLPLPKMHWLERMKLWFK